MVFSHCDVAATREGAAKAIKIHSTLGLLVADSRYLVRYDLDTGSRIGILADFGNDTSVELSDFVWQ